MSFEVRELYGDSDRIRLGVFRDGNKFSSLHIQYSSKSHEDMDWWDGEYWLKYILFPTIERNIERILNFSANMYSESPESPELPMDNINHFDDKRVLENISKYDLLEIYGLFQKAEALGWMEHIERIN